MLGSNKTALAPYFTRITPGLEKDSEGWHIDGGIQGNVIK